MDIEPYSIPNLHANLRYQQLLYIPRKLQIAVRGYFGKNYISIYTAYGYFFSKFLGYLNVLQVSSKLVTSILTSFNTSHVPYSHNRLLSEIHKVGVQYCLVFGNQLITLCNVCAMVRVFGNQFISCKCLCHGWCNNAQSDQLRHIWMTNKL